MEYFKFEASTPPENDGRTGMNRRTALPLGLLTSVLLLASAAVPARAQMASGGNGSASSDAVQTYVIDPVHSYVGFSARHMLVTRVRGTFNDFEGLIRYDPANVEQSTVDVTIEVESVDTENGRRDDHLRSSDFFEASSYPTITFQGTGVEREGEQLFLVGDLTIKETTREVRIPFELAGPVEVQGQKRLGAEAEIEVNRFDWGLTWDRAIETGGLVVSEDVTLELSVEATERSGEGP